LVNNNNNNNNNKKETISLLCIRVDTLAVLITRVWEYATDYKKISFTVRPTGYDVLRKQLRSQIVGLHLLWTLFGNCMEGQTSITDCVLGVYAGGDGWRQIDFTAESVLCNARRTKNIINKYKISC